MKKISPAIISVLLFLGFSSPTIAQPAIKTVSALPVARCAAGELEDKMFRIKDGVSSSDCAVGGGIVSADCVCDGGVFRVSGPYVHPRIVRVNNSAPDVPGITYSTIKDAMDYVATRTRTFELSWKVIVEGGGTYAEQPFSIPSFTTMECSESSAHLASWGAPATYISGSLTAGSFVTMKDNSKIFGCDIATTANSISPVTVVHCSIDGSSGQCVIEDVTVTVYELGASTQLDVAVFADLKATLFAYGLEILPFGENPNVVGIKVASTASAKIFGSRIEHCDGCKAAVQSLSNSPSYVLLDNVHLQLGYGAATPTWTLDISEEGTGVVYAVDTNYLRSSGNVINSDIHHLRQFAALPTCDTTMLGVMAIDTSNSNELCGCVGAGPAWAATDGAGTCD